MMSRRSIALALLGTASLSIPALGEKFAPPDFARQVEPILKSYCLGCHNEEDTQGGLLLTSRSEMLKGGKHGPALVPGKSAESRLVRMIEGSLKPKMPPKGQPTPTNSEVSILKAWIDAGAPVSLKPTAPTLAPAIVPRRSTSPSVSALAFSPTSDLIAISRHRDALLVDPASQLEKRRCAGHVGPVTALAFSSDGQRLFTASGVTGQMGEARAWSVNDGTLLKTFSGPRDALYAIAVSADGAHVAAAGYDKALWIWDANKGDLVATLKGHNDAIYGLAFNPDGRFIASASGDRTVKLWSVRDKARLDTFSQPTKDQYAVVFHPKENTAVAAGIDNRLRRWVVGASGRDGANRMTHARFAHQRPIIALAISAQGDRLASAAEDSTVKLWKLPQVEESLVLEAQPDWAQALSFSRDGKTLAVGRHDGSIALYDAATGSKRSDVTPRLPPPPQPVLASISPRGARVGVSNRIKLSGQNLDSIRSIKFSEPDISASVAASPAPTPQTVWIEVTPSGKKPRGHCELSVVAPGGESARLRLDLDDLPQVEEKEPNDVPSKALLLPLGSDCWGAVHRPGDVDCVTVRATKGQTVVIETAASSLGSKLSPMVQVQDEKGRVLAVGEDAVGRREPVIAFRAPADGNYTLIINDRKRAGSNEHFYRLAIGAFPYVESAFPLGGRAGHDVDVELIGHNLLADARAKVRLPAQGDAAVPIDPSRYRYLQAPKVVADQMSPVLEREPNDQPTDAQPIDLPGLADGRFFSNAAADVDHYRFRAKKGDRWVIETEAERRGSPIDTRLSVLDSAGRPVERIWLEAVRDSSVEFRNVNARQADIRVRNWREMELNELFYLGGEVCKTFRLPEGPDSGFVFYTVGGARRTYFDTTATTHALNDPCYVVVAHPPGTALVPNGLPVFKLAYGNDDAGDRRIGSDSRVYFDAPADGEYLVRVEEVRGLMGRGCAYRLRVRRPQPDFQVSIGIANAQIARGGAKEIEFNADRLDEFEGEIRIDLTGLPSGFRMISPLVIAAGQSQARASLFVEPTAPQPPANANMTSVTATAIINGKTVTKNVGAIGSLTVVPRAKIVARLEPARLTIAPGGSTTARLIIERHGFMDRLNFQVNNLPHGVAVDNIGLNGILIPPGETTRTISITARSWVPETTRPFHAVALAEGNQATPSVLLDVKRSGSLAQAK